MSFLADAGAIARRELLRYRNERTSLVGQLLMPVLAVLFIGFGLNQPVGQIGPGIDYASFLGAGLLVLTISSGAIGGGYTLIQELQQGFLRPILVAPVSRASIVAGKVAARLLLSALLVAAILLALSLFVEVPMRHPAAALAALMGITCGCVASGILLAARLRRLESFRVLAVFITVPLYFLSGMFFPLATMPPAMRALALANPLTYGVDLFRFGVLGLHELPLALDVGALLVLALLPSAFAARALEREES